MTLTRLDPLTSFEGMKPQSSYSALTLHRKCPQAWLYRYGMRLEPVEDTPTPYLTVGTWWALLQAVECMERGRAAESLVFVPRSLRDRQEGYDLDPSSAEVDEVLFAAQERWKRMTEDEQTEFIDKLGEPLPDRLDHMFQLWNEANPERFDRERPLGAEVFWKRALPRPEKDAAWSLLADPSKVPTMSLIGFIDELYYDRQRKMVVIKDGKAQRDIQRGNGATDDLMDSQLQLYAWGITPKLKREGIEPPRAVSFDRITSVAPKEPQLTATGTLSKSVTAYDAATYRRWALTDTRPSADYMEEMGLSLDQQMIVGQILDRPGRVWGKVGEYYASGAKKGQPKFGIYDLDEKVLEKLNSPGEQARWTSRSLDPINRRVVEAHLRAAVDTALDIYQTQQRAAATGAAARNLDRRGCTWCDFADICRAQLIGGSAGEYDLELYGLRQKPARGQKGRSTT